MKIKKWLTYNKARFARLFSDIGEAWHSFKYDVVAVDVSPFIGENKEHLLRLTAKLDAIDEQYTNPPDATEAIEFILKSSRDTLTENELRFKVMMKNPGITEEIYASARLEMLKRNAEAGKVIKNSSRINPSNTGKW